MAKDGVIGIRWLEKPDGTRVLQQIELYDWYLGTARKRWVDVPVVKEAKPVAKAEDARTARHARLTTV